MIAKDQKITLKGLQSEIVTLRKELKFNKKCLEEVQKELYNAKDEIKGRKDFKNIKENVSSAATIVIFLVTLEKV